MKKLMALFSSCFFLFSCSESPTDTSGGVSETGNAFVYGHVYNADHTPASGAHVRFVPVSYNPTSGTTPIDSVVTNSQGYFSLAALDNGTYNVLCSGIDGAASLHAALKIAADTQAVGPETLQAPGSMRGVIKLDPPVDSALIFVILLGTNTYAMADSTGRFVLSGLAKGEYEALVLTTEAGYNRADTVWTFLSGIETSLNDTIVLNFFSLPSVSGLTLDYDSLRQIVHLVWNKPINPYVRSYNIYRRNVDSSTAHLVNTTPIVDTFFADGWETHLTQGNNYLYHVLCVDSANHEGGYSIQLLASVTTPFIILDTVIDIGDTIAAMDRDAFGNYYIVSLKESKIMVYDSLGVFKREWSVSGSIGGNFHDFAKIICIDKSFNIFLARTNEEILVYDTIGNLGNTLQTNFFCGMDTYESSLLAIDWDTRSIYKFTVGTFIRDTFIIPFTNDIASYTLFSITCSQAGNIFLLYSLGSPLGNTTSVRIYNSDKQIITNFQVHRKAGNISAYSDNQLLLTTRDGQVYSYSNNGELLFRFNGMIDNSAATELILGTAENNKVILEFTDGKIITYWSAPYHLNS
ncbi:MAG: hypothetical protein A2293_13395 [Elusimicrobia bacterium RIFOXYB2_FULL_49_7]|nr:MAG: hypothetical protein A2293_13395 [Elusimicrobia bacterium RIFOXYB2_FULL_49_7]